MIKLTLLSNISVNNAIKEMHFLCNDELSFHAGQYLELLIPGQTDLFFTIASSPLEEELILLVENRMADIIAKHCLDTGYIAANPAAGDCHIDNLNEYQHLFLIAAGSGFSQMRSICQEVMLKPINKKVTFLWGNDSVFAQELIQSWQPTIDVQIQHIDDNAEKHQQLVKLAKELLPNKAENIAVIACGSPNMVYPLFDYLNDRGLVAGNMLADVFQFMPRE